MHAATVKMCPLLYLCYFNVPLNAFVFADEVVINNFFCITVLWLFMWYIQKRTETSYVCMKMFDDLV